MKLHYVLLLIISCFSSALLGSEDVSLYSAAVPVLSQSVDERTNAAKEGLKQVLMKLTGSSAVVENNAAIRQEVQRAAYYLQDFHYQLASISASRHTLNLVFSQQDINDLLAKENIPIWQGKRPTVLLWLLYQDGESTQVVSYDMAETVLPELPVYADQRGLPILLPFMDTQELSYLTDFDGKEIPVSAFEQLSKRYTHDALLIGQLVQKDKQWLGKWTLLNHQVVLKWEQRANDANVLLSAMLNEVAEYFFKLTKPKQPTNGVVS